MLWLQTLCGLGSLRGVDLWRFPALVRLAVLALTGLPTLGTTQVGCGLLTNAGFEAGSTGWGGEGPGLTHQNIPHTCARQARSCANRI